ncbi:taste receptor type 2 member 104-like [Protopterus annectens]|uniref:taste receptor type 2 member 104-like n=1 Tax=Protopterus annectens TaxID=7888 RepID=UPI001CFAEEB3|nr:taste receptor type 2 member 104-like [Protopterus annectens]
MLADMKEILIAVSTLLYILGLLGHIFIIVINIKDFRENKGLSPGDLILLSLGVSNILLQSDEYIFVICSVLNQACYLGRCFNFADMFCSAVCLWFLTWICVFYYVKITNSTQRVLFKLKQNISVIVPYQLLGTVVGSTIISGTVVLTGDLTTHVNNTFLTEECPSDGYLFNFLFMYNVYIYLFNVLPFLIMLTCNLLIIISLRQHTCRMETSPTALSNSHFTVYIRVAKMSASLIFANILFIADQIYFAVMLQCKQTALDYTLLLYLMIYPIICTVLLIYGNTKLRKACVNLCQWINSTESAKIQVSALLIFSLFKLISDLEKS